MLGDADDRPGAEEARGVGDGLAVVPGGDGDQAAVALLLCEVGDEVDAAPHLEGSGRQVVLVLDARVRAHELRQAGVGVQRGGP